MKKVILILIILIVSVMFFLYKSKPSLKPKLTTSIINDINRRSNLNVITTDQDGNIIGGTSNVGLNYLNVEGNDLLGNSNLTEINNLNINNTLNVLSNSITTNFNTKNQKIKRNQNVGNIQNIKEQNVTTQNVNEDSEITSININKNGTFNLLPKGVIILWGSPHIPQGWTICNGENETPDLRDRFIVSIGTKYNWKDTGGEKDVTLKIDEIPIHSHGGHNHDCVEMAVGQQDQRHFANCKQNSSVVNSGGKSDGSTDSHNNIPPYYALYYIMKL